MVCVLDMRSSVLGTGPGPGLGLSSLLTGYITAMMIVPLSAQVHEWAPTNLILGGQASIQ